MGYLPKEMVRRDRNEIGVIFLDAVFTPIRRVSYEVENMRVGDRTDYNRLRLSIDTDGTITPHQALERSIEIMISQLKAMIGFRSEEEENMLVEDGRPGEEEDLSKKDISDSLKTRIEDLDLSTRTSKALTNDGIRTVGGLVRKKEGDLTGVEGLGSRGIEEIKEALEKLGLALKE